MEVSTQQCERAEPFVQATIDTFKTMMRLEVRRAGIEAHDFRFTHDVSGVIGLTGGAEGSVSLAFRKDTALAVASSFLGERDVSDCLMADTVGELVNIITGYAGKDIKGPGVRISLPTIVMGPGHVITIRRRDLQTVTSLVSPLGTFHLYVYFEEIPWSASPAGDAFPA